MSSLENQEGRHVEFVPILTWRSGNKSEGQPSDEATARATMDRWLQNRAVASVELVKLTHSTEIVEVKTAAVPEPPTGSILKTETGDTR